MNERMVLVKLVECPHVRMQHRNETGLKSVWKTMYDDVRDIKAPFYYRILEPDIVLISFSMWSPKIKEFYHPWVTRFAVVSLRRVIPAVGMHH